jgi:hypothetical protein
MPHPECGRWSVKTASGARAAHGHLTERGETSRFNEVFTDDIVYDLSALGGGVLADLYGLTGRKRAAVEDPRNPIAQHLTNIVLTPTSAGPCAPAERT